MAKRFTDSEKWKDAWFMSLKPAHKLFWFYVLDNCDHAGIWNCNFKLASFQLGMELDEAELAEVFAGRFKLIEQSLWFIPTFIDFQYGAIKETNNLHCSVLKTLNRYKINQNISGADEPLTSPSRGAMDKDKDKDKERDKEKRGDARGDLPEVGNQDLEDAYERYPRKVGKSKGISKAKREVQTRDELANFNQAIANYRAYVLREKTEPSFIKHFSTFVSEWRDWVSVDNGRVDPDFSAKTKHRGIAEILADEERSRGTA